MTRERPRAARVTGAASQQGIKQSNLRLLFRLIDREEPISRAELAQRTGLSPTTVSTLVDELLENRLVEESGTASGGSIGRKAILLRVFGPGGYALAMELSAGRAACKVYDLKCRPVAQAFRRVSGGEDWAALAADLALETIRQAAITPEQLLCVCAGIPAMVDSARGRILSSTVLPDLAGTDLPSAFSRVFPGVPLLLENNSSLLAYAHLRFDGGDTVRDLISVDVNEGIGAGIVVDGSIYRGADGLAGEVGHICIDPLGPLCRCGRQGCLEAMAAIPAILALTGHTGLTAQALGQAADQGDPWAQAALDTAACRLGSGLSALAHLFNPRTMVLSGEVTALGEGFLTRLRHQVLEQGVVASMAMTLRYSRLGEDAMLLGAGRFGLDDRLGSPDFYG